MQPFRLLIVATAMVAVLALVAGLAAENDRVQRSRPTTTGPAAVVPSRAPSQVIEAKIPREEPIVAKVGQAIELTVTLDQPDQLVLPAFGLDEGIAERIPTPVLFNAIAPGRYQLKLQNSGRVVAELVVEADGARQTGTQSTPAPAPAPAAPEPEESPAVPGPATA